MKEVLDLIQKRKLEFAQVPLFKYMRDKSIHPRQRLSFAPCLIPLAMNFADLCKYVWREEPTDNKLQKIINQHTYEEHFHWQWLLEDLEKMGFNHLVNSTDAVKFIWGDDLKRTRLVCSIIERYTLKADPIYKLAAIQVAEVTANIFFAVSKPVALQLQEITNEEYKYFGMYHMSQEVIHDINQPAIVKLFEDIQLTEESRKQAFVIVDEVFNGYTEAMHEWLKYATKSEKMQLLEVA